MCFVSDQIFTDNVRWFHTVFRTDSFLALDKHYTKSTAKTAICQFCRKVQHIKDKQTCSQKNVILAKWSPSPKVDGIKCRGISMLELGARIIGRSFSRSREKLLVLEIWGINSRVSSVGLSRVIFCFVHLQGTVTHVLFHVVQHTLKVLTYNVHTWISKVAINKTTTLH